MKDELWELRNSKQAREYRKLLDRASKARRKLELKVEKIRRAQAKRSHDLLKKMGRRNAALGR